MGTFRGLVDLDPLAAFELTAFSGGQVRSWGYRGRLC